MVEMKLTRTMYNVQQTSHVTRHTPHKVNAKGITIIALSILPHVILGTIYSIFSIPNIKINK